MEKKFMDIDFKNGLGVKNILTTYCEDTKESAMAVGIHAGIVSMADEDVFASTSELNMIHFYMGIWYALKHKNKLNVRYFTEKQLEERKKNKEIANKKFNELKKALSVEKNKAPYIG